MFGRPVPWPTCVLSSLDARAEQTLPSTWEMPNFAKEDRPDHPTPKPRYIAMAGDEIIMPENAFLMIHDPSGLVMGTAADMRDMAGTLDKIAALLAAETQFDAAEALEAGLAARLAEPVRIAASFDIGRFRNAPPELVEAVEAVEPGSAATDADIVDEPTMVHPPSPIMRRRGMRMAPTMPLLLVGPTPPADDTDSTVAAASTAPDPTAIRAEAIAHARAVIDLCRLPGQPQMAGRFLEQDANLDEVRAALLAAKAEAEPEITPHHRQRGRSSTTRPWGDVIARTLKLKG